MEVTLKQEVMRNVRMNVAVENNTKLELEIKFGFSVSYRDNNSTAVARLSQDVHMKDDPAKFNISVEAIGVFACSGISTDEDKKHTHVEAYKQLFPYVRNFIRMLTVEAGLPPLTLEPVKMSVENVRLDSQKADSVLN